MVGLAMWIGSDAIGVEEQMAPLSVQVTMQKLGRLMIGWKRIVRNYRL